jgi:glycosidase
MKLLGLIALLTGLISCAKPEKKSEIRTVVSPDWSRNAVIYEVNIRQFSPEGTITKVEEQLPRLKAMGVDILWLMPVHPIGKMNRKGSMGSYYAVQDYLGFNPEFGTEDDFRRFVTEAHALGMKVILDWVANHTAWDNPLLAEHPDWFTRDGNGNPVPPVPDWADVIDLDYSKPELRRYMTDAMLYWVREFDIDGYRCDVAGMVPVDFWNATRAELDAVKKVFMLAEADDAELLVSAFDMAYGWKMHHVFNELVKGHNSPSDIDSIAAYFATAFAKGSTVMQFTSNHDENSWSGTEFERLGAASDVFAVLSYTLPGMPLIYSGQESACDKRLAFFEKDPIQWGTFEKAGFYTTLSTLKHSSPALKHGEEAGTYRLLSATDKHFVFERKSGAESVVVFANLSAEAGEITVREKSLAGTFTNVFDGSTQAVTGEWSVSLPAWGYAVWTR